MCSDAALATVRTHERGECVNVQVTTYIHPYGLIKSHNYLETKLWLYLPVNQTKYHHTIQQTKLH